MQNDIKEAIRFLRLLDTEAIDFTFQTFDDYKNRRDGSLAQIFNGPLVVNFKRMSDLNKRGAGVFVTVNETDLKGRKNENIKRIRCVFQELDDGEVKDDPIEPSIVVQSSEGKLHKYWLCNDLNKADFDGVLDRMVADYGSDNAAKGQARVLRLPGFHHMKDANNPQMVTIIHESGGQNYKRDQILNAFPPVINGKVKKAGGFDDVDLDLVTQLRAALNYISPNNYKTWVDVGLALSGVSAGGRGLWLEWGASYPDFNHDEAAKKWETFNASSISYKSIFKMAQDSGWINAGEVATIDSEAVLTGAGVACFGNKKPNEIKTKSPPVPVLSEDLIPEPFSPWLADVSHRMQTPPDFATVSALVVTGSIIGSGCGMRPKQMDSWEVIPNLWGACISRPSVMLKSPSMGEVMQVLDKLQAKYGEQFEQEKIEAEFDSLAMEAQLKDIKGQITKKGKGEGKDSVVNADDMAVLKESYMELKQDAESEPARRLFKTNETSIQSMTVIQNDNPRGVVTFRDELMGLLVKWDREDGADERAYFLEGWNGDGSYTDVKIGRGLTDAKNICISLLGGIQPDKLSRYLYQAMKGNNDGLIQRLQLAVWPDEPEEWKSVDITPDKAAKKKAYEILEVLADMDFTQYGAVQGEYDERPYYRFSDEGQVVFNDWLEELQTVKIKYEERPLMVEHFGKFRSLMPSLALIFHLVDIADGKPAGPVSEKAALLSVEWCKYLESHARRIYAMADSPEHEAAVSLAEKIKDNKLPNPFTVKKVYDKGWHRLKDKKEVQAACEVLIDENWLSMTRKTTGNKGGRPPLPEYCQR